MTTTFTARGEQLVTILRTQEQQADGDQLFAFGYLIPQVELVAYNAAGEADDFDTVFWQQIEAAFVEDNMSAEDRALITATWEQAKRAANTEMECNT